MKRKLQKLFFCFSFLLIATFSAHAQEIITGKVIDASTKESLPSAPVSIKGSTIGTTTGLDGTFKLKIPNGTVTLIVSYAGYVTKEIRVSGQKSLGTIGLNSSSSALTEVVVTANPSQVIDRKTPIAVSTVNQTFIEEKGAGAEFPELIKSTPGVTVTRQGGGYGDSRVSIRGFSSNNVALLINGIPVNAVESGKIYWNDWAGLSDVTKTMQVQRGLGASTVAAPSLGGTIGINTFTTETVEGGSVSQTIGSFNSLKTSVSYSTGLSKKGWASSVLLSRSTGDGNANGLYYTGYNYFFNLSKVLTPSQTLSFTVLGASQNHGQRYTRNLIDVYKSSPDGVRYNSDFGYLNGQMKSAEVNFYNSPLYSLNHDWKINEKSSLATVAYLTTGKGAAQYLVGKYSVTPGSANEVPRTGDEFSPIDFDKIVDENVANKGAAALSYIQNITDEHQQYGVLSSYKTKLTSNIDLLAGLDLRYYEGSHFYEVADLLGGQYIVNNDDVNNPSQVIGVGGKFNRNYKYSIATEGLYLQSEYEKDNLTAFVALAVNNTGNQRLDYFDYLNSDPNRKTDYVNFLGYQTKGGANYNLDEHNNVFANIGYLQRAPLVSSIFPNTGTSANDVNDKAVPEKLFSYELGYGYRSSALNLNVNLYRSTYKDRSVTPSLSKLPDGTYLSANLTGLNELHQGVEIDAKYKPVKVLQLTGQLSLGDWHYTSDAGPVIVTSDANPGNSATIDKIYIKGQKVGDAAQTTASVGFNLDVTPKMKVGSNYDYYTNYNAFFNPENLTSEGYQPYSIPSYGILDMNIVYRFKMAGLDASLIGNVYNVLNTEYLSDVSDYFGGNSSSTLFKSANGPTPVSKLHVYYGTQRTFFTTLKIKF